MRYPLTEPEFRQIYAKVPRLCVDVHIYQKGKILLTKRKIDPFKGLWHIPGGTVYFGETVEAAAIRVARQELGIKTRVASFLGILESLDEYKGAWHGWPIALEFKMELLSGKIKGSDQAEEFAFFDKLPEPMVEVQRHFLSKRS